MLQLLHQRAQATQSQLVCVHAGLSYIFTVTNIYYDQGNLEKKMHFIWGLTVAEGKSP